MKRNRPSPLWFAPVVFGVVAATSLAACKREAAPAPAAAPAAADQATAAPAPTEANAAGANVRDATAAAAFDVKAFAGRFSAQGLALNLLADGSFALEPSGAAPLTGTWTLEADGATLLLDPNSKAEPDRRYRMLGQDELQAVASGTRLRREAP